MILQEFHTSKDKSRSSKTKSDEGLFYCHSYMYILLHNNGYKMSAGTTNVAYHTIIL